jgi:hypothetical protein
MRNKYGGKCYRCKIWVAPGTGYFERVPGKGWRVQHSYTPHNGGVTCEIPTIAKLQDTAEMQANADI